MADSASVFELLESAIEKIKRDYNSDWLITNAEWDSHTCIPLNNISNSRKNSLYNEFHMHSFFEITVLLEGKSSIRVCDVVKEMDNGNVFILPPGYNHQDLPYENGRYMAMWLMFEPGEVSMHLAGRDGDDEFFVKGYHMLDIDYILYNELLYDIRKELRNNSRWSLDIIKISVINLLIIVNQSLELKKHSDNREDWKYSIVKSVIRYIDDNCQKNHTLSGIPQHFGISMNYINCIFKSIVGKTVINYLNDSKIIKAKELLLTTNMTIKEIAIQLGYYDQYHFSKSFKKSIGMSPTNFRKSANDSVKTSDY